PGDVVHFPAGPSRARGHMQPPTWLPALPNGVHFWPLGHSPSEVHMMMPVQVPAATQMVLCIVWAKLPQPGMPRPIDARGAQHTGFVGSLQSATGSSQPQSVEPARHAVARGVQAEGTPASAAVSQQCSVEGLQYMLLPPSTPLNGQ